MWSWISWSCCRCCFSSAIYGSSLAFSSFSCVWNWAIATFDSYCIRMHLRGYMLQKSFYTCSYLQFVDAGLSHNDKGSSLEISILLTYHFKHQLMHASYMYMIQIVTSISLEVATYCKSKYNYSFGLWGSYRIAGKFGGDFNLAVWRIVRTSPNLNSRHI